MVLVDSSVWVEVLRKNGASSVKAEVAKLLDSAVVCTCGPVRLEILGAARKQERKKIDHYFGAIPSLKVRDIVWKDAVVLSRQMRDGGHSIPWNDLLIASIALSHSVPVYSRDRHFDEISKTAGLALYAASQ